MEKIPSYDSPKRYEVSAFRNSEFIELKDNDIFDINLQYPLMKMKNAEIHCYVRKEVYLKLLYAHKLLPEGYKLRIFDAWRPFALQEELYERYSQEIVREFHLEGCSESQKKEIIERYVSEPVCDWLVPPVHTTGGAVDLTILDNHQHELDMGTGFDAFSDEAHTAYFENGKNNTVRDNRRLLYNVMTCAGFTNLPSEWWHFDFGDHFWGYYCQKPAIFRGVFTKEEMNESGESGRE